MKIDFYLYFQLVHFQLSKYICWVSFFQLLCAISIQKFAMWPNTAKPTFVAYSQYPLVAHFTKLKTALTQFFSSFFELLTPQRGLWKPTKVLICLVFPQNKLQLDRMIKVDCCKCLACITYKNRL